MIHPEATIVIGRHVVNDIVSSATTGVKNISKADAASIKRKQMSTIQCDTDRCNILRSNGPD